ncbi:hypothetical protein CG91_gp047 [Mycobacterium phage 39HC]|uniref:hypothetical protein n=1 Tax=Mycobacterium phage 39HC TaxID=1463809 RepID=UPI0003F1F215|nr:hypothetical protein CG91_gp047 [Mycobacterium phage 39HC]AHJ88347.1 hypothetical protein 39HC_047 [Mycobacterium phage 39HC]AHJ88447.1 hypothetical protein 40BC_047 [Mycobacterium phage 40BC]
MPVTFKTSALITAATEALDGHRKADAQYQADCEAYRAEKLAEADMLPRLKALRDELSAFLKTKRQPTKADAARFKRAAGEDYIHSLYTGSVSDYDIRNNVPKPSGWLQPTTAASWEGLIKMLQAHTEDTITANQLKLFGYDRLEPLFRNAALHSPVTNQ